MSTLEPGIYERLVTDPLRRALADAHGAGLVSELAKLEAGEESGAVSQHLTQAVLAALRVAAARTEGGAVKLGNQILEVVRQATGEGAVRDGLLADVSQPPEQLLAVHEAPQGLGEVVRAERPAIPLSKSDLLVNARDEHRIGVELQREIATADEIDLICAFLKWSGYRVLQDALEKHLEAGRPLRVLTTAYMGATEERVLDVLMEQGAEIRTSCDTRRTRLHAKAWLFRRKTGYSTAYIGSSNLSRAALLDGLEWNVRLSQIETPDILSKFEGHFESYWNDGEFEDYGDASVQERFRQALASEGRAGDAEPTAVLLDLKPYPYQQEILDRLLLERERGYWRNLIVAATGTGKTVIAALDFKYLTAHWEELAKDATKRPGGPTLLFVAHRQEILKQSRDTFRIALRDGVFGELQVAGQRPVAGTHVFASIQSLHHQDLKRLSPTAYDVVIVDEFHHAEAPTYRRLLDHLQPKLLLGMTATPERTDGVNVQDAYFGGRTAAELRVWDAIERGMLCPFQYFGVHDGTELDQLTWSRGRYNQGEIENLYTADDARLILVLEALRRRIANPLRMRALGFCVGVQHAEFMARRFTEHGIPAIAVTGSTPTDERRAALRRLRQRDVNVVFTVDLFNEGVDVPEVDTVLFLRPTESATLFLQQLGRGLRLSDDKDCLTVLDFIGQANRRFRFDLRFRAVTGGTRRQLEDHIREGFPLLPSGCSIELDRVAQEIVLRGVREALPMRRPELVRDLKQVAQLQGGRPRLAEFLHETGLELEDLYRNRGASWFALCRQAQLDVPKPGPDEVALQKALFRLQHWDDRVFLDTMRRELSAAAPPDLEALPTADVRRLTMLTAGLLGRGRDELSLKAKLDVVWQHPAVRYELLEMIEVQLEKIDVRTPPWDAQPDVPLAIHATYSQEEILAAFGQSKRLQGGVYHEQSSGCDLLFITLHKSEKHYSPATMYDDYAISPERFHWQSQNTASIATPAGKRYVEPRPPGSPVLLFVRHHKLEAGRRTAPYHFLGPAEYVRHKGEKPMSIEWRMVHVIPHAFYRETRLSAG